MRFKSNCYLSARPLPLMTPNTKARSYIQLYCHFHSQNKTKQINFTQFSMIIILLMKAISPLAEQFTENIQFHSIVTPFSQNQAFPLFKLTVKPYDYYIRYSFQGTLSTINFYQQLQALSTLIVMPEHFQLKEIQESYFQRLFSLSEKNKFSISCYERYYNFTLDAWITHQKECNSVISEQEILMVFRQLLAFHQAYYNEYAQNCNIFKPELIFITPEKSLRVYPQSIAYNGQIAVHRENQIYLQNSNAKLDKQFSIQTTLTNSQIHEEEHSPIENCNVLLRSDVRDIFLLVLEMISFKKHEHFWSKKHQRIVWDSVKSVLNSTQASYLSSQFLNLLRDCAENRFMQVDWLLTELQRIISSKNRVCKTIHIEKNQQLAQLIQKKAEEAKNKKLMELKFLHKHQLQRELTKHSSF